MEEGDTWRTNDFFIGGDFNIEVKLEDCGGERFQGVDSFDWYGLFGERDDLVTFAKKPRWLQLLREFNYLGVTRDVDGGQKRRTDRLIILSARATSSSRHVFEQSLVESVKKGWAWWVPRSDEERQRFKQHVLCRKGSRAQVKIGGGGGGQGNNDGDKEQRWRRQRNGKISGKRRGSVKERSRPTLGANISTKSLNGKLHWPCDERSWLSKDFTKLR